MATYKKTDEKKSKKKKSYKLKARFEKLHGKKGDILRRTEDYAMWTLPYLFPPTGTKHAEMQGSLDSTGARAVNHLSNKVTMTMFPAHQPFFRLMVANDIMKEFKVRADEGDEDAQMWLDNLDGILADAEKDAMQELDYNTYRTEATMASKLLIVTGNALLYHPEKEDSKAQTYNLRDYCIVRDLSGNMIELITRDSKALSTFSDEIKDALRAANGSKYDKEDTDVTLYTCVKLEDDGKFHLQQDIENVKLDSEGSWPLKDLPWIPLTWNLVRGEDYGRGLVEDYAGAFHSLYVLNASLVDVIGIAADIKFLVNPNSVLDVKALNDSESGTYHSGAEGDVTTVQIDKVNDIKLVIEAIDRFQKQIGQAFLLNSAVTRDAERVTAEEIRYVAQELELSHGGIYSRFAVEWQYRTARLLLKKVDINLDNKAILPQIITGLDSLSRAGDLDNLRMMVSDLSMLDAVPEEIRAGINPIKFASFVGTRRGVDYEKFLYTQDELNANRQAEMQQQQAMMAQQEAAKAAGGVAQEAGKQAMKEE